MNRVFFWPDNRRYVLFTEAALAQMYRHVQRWPWQKEAGGELFAVDPDASGIHITNAAGPSPCDHRARNAYKPDIDTAHRERLRQFDVERYAVGLWHTHPEAVPKPSYLDQQTTTDYLLAFTGDRTHFLMAILGNRGDPPNMQVWSVGGTVRREWIRLSEL